MRMLFGLLVTLVVSVGAVGDGHSVNAARETASQASPAPVPKCIIPPIPASGECHLSKKKKEFIRWQAPPNEDLWVCFIDPTPFTKGEFHVSAGKSEDTKLHWFVKKGSSQFSVGNTKCPQPPSDKDRATARVIIED